MKGKLSLRKGMFGDVRLKVDDGEACFAEADDW